MNKVFSTVVLTVLLFASCSPNEAYTPDTELGLPQKEKPKRLSKMWSNNPHNPFFETFDYDSIGRVIHFTAQIRYSTTSDTIEFFYRYEPENNRIIATGEYYRYEDLDIVPQLSHITIVDTLYLNLQMNIEYAVRNDCVNGTRKRRWTYYFEYNDNGQLITSVLGRFSPETTCQWENGNITRMDGTIYTYTHLTNNLPSSILPGVNSDWSPLSQYGWFGKHPQNLPYKMESEGNPDTKFVYNYRMENGLISFSTCTHSNHGHFVEEDTTYYEWK